MRPWSKENKKKKKKLHALLYLGNKEVISVLHKSNQVISYNDIRMQNLTWARMVSLRQLHFFYFARV